MGSNAKLYIHRNEQVEGPYSTVQLAKMAARGKVAPDVLVADEGADAEWVSLVTRAPREVIEAIQSESQRKLRLWIWSGLCAIVALALTAVLTHLHANQQPRIASLEAENLSIQEAFTEAQQKLKSANEQITKASSEGKNSAVQVANFATKTANTLKQLESTKARLSKVEVIAAKYANRLASQTAALQGIADIPEKTKIHVSVDQKGVLRFDSTAIESTIANRMSGEGFFVTQEPEIGVSEALVITASVSQLNIAEESRAAYNLQFTCYTRCLRGEAIKAYQLYENSTYGYAGTKSGYETAILEFFSTSTVKCIAKINQARQDALKQEKMDAIFEDLASMGISANSNLSIGGSQIPSGIGSGIIVASRPLVLTNFHVIKGATKITIHSPTLDGKEAIVLYTDPVADLAVITLKESNGSFKNDTFASMVSHDELQIGQDVYSLGFPMSSILGSEVKYSSGTISSTKGLRDDPARFQLSVPTQPGNSGGPVFLRPGKLAGIIVSTLDSLAIVKAMSSLPQNVNYAIRADTITLFLQEHGLLDEMAGDKRGPLNVDDAKRHAVRIEAFDGS